MTGKQEKDHCDLLNSWPQWLPHQVVYSTQCGTPNIATPLRANLHGGFHSIDTDPVVASPFP